MSLPPALLKRLRQRGLALSQQAAASEGVEEIIAENYDEDEKSQRHSVSESSNVVVSKRKNGDDNFWSDRIKERIGVTESYHGYKFCPNKYNIWHKCTLYCVNRWTIGRPKPNEKYMRRFKRLTRKYPLEAGWKEMYDTGCGCYYFYNSALHKVSWLPPSHPKARITNSATTFRKQLANSNDEFSFDTEEYGKSKSKDSHLVGAAGESESSSKYSTALPAKKQKARDLERTLLRKRRNDK